MLALPAWSHLLVVNDAYFTRQWMRGAVTGPADIVSPEIVADDIAALNRATAKVQEIGDRSVAHRQRVHVGELRIADIDGAFDAIEACVTKYYTLLRGSSIMGLEPTAQYDTLELYTFPWLEARLRTPGRE